MEYKPNHRGAVVTFRPGISKEEIRAALKKIEDVLDEIPEIHIFDDRWGEPVWYIP